MAAIAAKEPALTEPVHCPNIFATGVMERTVGGITEIIFFIDRFPAWPGTEVEREIVARLTMETHKWEDTMAKSKHACIRDCLRRVPPLTVS